MGKQHNISSLKSIQSKLKSNLRHLMWEYDDYRYYYNGRAPEQAENKFYSEMFELSGHDVYYEGLFSLNHKPLKVRIKENRKKRNKISSKLKEIKNEIKIQQRNENNRNISKK